MMAVALATIAVFVLACDQRAALAMGDKPPVEIGEITPTPTPTPVAETTPEPLIPGKPGATHYVARARAAEQAGDAIAAATLFLRAAQAYPTVADGALDEAARLQSAAGRHTDAIKTLRILQQSHGARAVALRVLDRLAKAHDQAGDKQTAVRLHLTAGNEGGDVNRKAFHLLRAAELQHEMGQNASAVTLAKRLLNELPPHRYTIRAMTLYHQWALPGDLPAQARHAEELGRRMLKKDMYEQAAAALHASVTLRTRAGKPVAPTSELWRLAGYSLYRTHHNEQAVVYYEKRFAAGGTPTAENLHELGKLYARLGDAKGVKRAYDRVSRHGSGSYHLTAAYQKAWLAIEERDYAKAHAYFAKRCQATRNRNELACWLAGWTAFQRGHKKTAINYFTQAAANRRFQETWRYKYWRGRALLESGGVEKGLAALHRLNKDRPHDYYGVLAADILRQRKAPYIDLKDHMARPAAGGYSLAPPPAGWWREYDELKNSLGHVIELTDVGLWRAAGAELVFVQLPKKLSPPEDYALAEICRRAKRYDLARKCAYRGGVYHYVKNSRVSLLDGYYPYYLPLGYEDWVLQYAKQFRLPPALPFAIILHESGYRAQVVSPAYAVGLMQILPQTGAQIAQGLGEAYDEDSLYDPETNIRFGCWYLRHLLDELGGDPAYAIAAYNAGPKAVGKWLRNKRDAAQTQFVAEIVYQETNRYVRRVLTSMKKYEVLLQSRDNSG